MENIKKVRTQIEKEGKAKIGLGKEGNISFDYKSNVETFKIFYADLVMNHVRQLPLPTNMFGTNSVK